MAVATPQLRLRGTLRTFSRNVRATELGAGILFGLVAGTLVAYQWSPQFVMLFQLITAGALVLLLVVVAWRNPAIAMAMLLVGVPLHQLLFGRLFLLGVDVRLLSAARYWKEVVIAVLVIKVLRSKRKEWTALDMVVLAFLALTMLYVVVPMGPPLFPKLLAARVDSLFLVVFLVGRYTPGIGSSVGKLEATVLVVGVLAAVFAFWNALSPADFSHWLYSTGITRYRLEALDVALPLNANLTTEGGEVLRVGSFFGNALSLAYYLLIPCGFVVARAVRGALRPFDVLTGIVCVTALVLTLTRSALLGLLLMVVLALLFGAKRTRFLLVAAAVFLIVSPFLRSLPGIDRLSVSDAASPASNAGHLAGLRASKDLFVQQPLGSGLGTAGPLIHRFKIAGVVNESWYFQIGSELGVAGMLLFVALVLIVLRALRSRARAPNAFALGPFCALAGVALGGLVLHTFDDLAVAWTVWLAAGLALRPDDSTEPDPIQA